MIFLENIRKSLIFIVLIIIFQTALNVYAENASSPDSFIYEKIILKSKAFLEKISENRISKEKEVSVRKNISATEAKNLQVKDKEFKKIIEEKLKKIDLNLLYSLEEKTVEQLQLPVDSTLATVAIYRIPDFTSKPIGYVELPGVVNIINKQGDYIKVRVSEKEAVWLHLKEISSQALEAVLETEIDLARQHLESKMNIQRNYYRDGINARWGVSALGVLGGAFLLCDGVSKTSGTPFFGQSIAGFAHGTASVLGAVEILAGAYVLYQSFSYLLLAQDVFVYSQLDKDEESFEIMSDGSAIKKQELVTEDISEETVPDEMSKSVEDGPLEKFQENIH